MIKSNNVVVKILMFMILGATVPAMGDLEKSQYAQAAAEICQGALQGATSTAIGLATGAAACITYKTFDRSMPAALMAFLATWISLNSGLEPLLPGRNDDQGRKICLMGQVLGVISSFIIAQQNGYLP